jgi:hypothetical protein
MLLQMLLLTLACLLVYTQHKQLFRRAAMSFPRFWDSALSAQRTILRRLATAPAATNLKWELNLLD